MTWFETLRFRISVWILALTILFSGGGLNTAQPTETQAASVDALREVLPLRQDTVTEGTDEVVETYQRMMKNARFGPVLPGLTQDFVPQGLAYSDLLAAFLISGYYEGAKLPSTLTVVDALTGKAKKTLIFGDEDGGALDGHFGGVAAHGQFVYAVSKQKLFVYDTAIIRVLRDGAVLSAARVFDLPVQGSFCTAGAGALWVGSFVQQTASSAQEEDEEQPPAAPQTGDMVGYRFSSCALYGLQDPETPAYSARIPALAQGAAFFRDGTLVFSCSYGRTKHSKLYIFHDVSPENWTDDAAFLTEDAAKTLTAPPMSEGMTVFPGGLAILFESGAACYRTDGGRYPLDRLVFLKKSAL